LRRILGRGLQASKALIRQRLFGAKHEVRVTGQASNRVEVTFAVREDEAGRPFIALQLTRDGQPAAGERLFTFDLAPDLAADEVEMLVQALNRCITHLGMALPEDESSDEA
jgi:hypothetical protein